MDARQIKSWIDEKMDVKTNRISFCSLNRGGLSIRAIGATHCLGPRGKGGKK